MRPGPAHGHRVYPPLRRIWPPERRRSARIVSFVLGIERAVFPAAYSARTTMSSASATGTRLRQHWRCLSVWKEWDGHSTSDLSREHESERWPYWLPPKMSCRRYEAKDRGGKRERPNGTLRPSFTVPLLAQAMLVRNGTIEFTSERHSGYRTRYGFAVVIPTFPAGEHHSDFGVRVMLWTGLDIMVVKMLATHPIPSLACHASGTSSSCSSGIPCARLGTSTCPEVTPQRRLSCRCHVLHVALS
ncbi:hypothetical protein C8Q74DRAFT_1221885 [Fomes fomentarius]|nr:hypothetical protein C8Q74DRAFT_1221885 [Fomes fomentarius]